MISRTLNGTRVRVTLQLREPPVADREFLELRAASGARTFIHRRVLRDAASLTRRSLPNETGALLMGATFTDGRQPFTIVTDLVVPLPGEVIGTSATVTITAAGRRRMEAEGRLRDPIASGVGWMHSHPVQMAFFSGTDEIEQSKWSGPASVGLVVSGRDDADPRFRVFLGAMAEEASEAGRVVAPRHVRRDARSRIRRIPPRPAEPVPALRNPERTVATARRRTRADVRRNRRFAVALALALALAAVVTVAMLLTLAPDRTQAPAPTSVQPTPTASPQLSFRPQAMP